MWHCSWQGLTFEVTFNEVVCVITEALEGRYQVTAVHVLAFLINLLKIIELDCIVYFELNHSLM